MRLELKDSDITFFAIGVTLTLTALLLLFIWALRWLWRKYVDNNRS
jgi:hypothetical protein